ncbi:MAG TPA: GNAT family N-acetyltransferase [Xanthobacteraceae bacterium]|nr:GNAT family N-acetyltransferase [Xanthobacteraceae bacterium]
MNGPSFRVRVEPSILAVARETWDACASGIPTGTGGVKRLSGFKKPDSSSATAPKRVTRAKTAAKTAADIESASQSSPYNPLISHDFLASLEESGCATIRTGWLGRHLLVEDETGAVLAAMPAYLKNHSRGEYVFDQGWAEAFERAGGGYYPKLQSAVPFTPVTGPRLLVRPGPSAEAARQALVAGALEIVKRDQASSLHITFPNESDWRYLTGLGFLARTDRQFHWFNEGYASFEDFLGALSSRKRKTIHRERRDAQNGVEIVRLTGSGITEDAWDAFFAFYMDTGARKWGSPYLNRSFFSIVSGKMRDKILLVMARAGGRYIAGALNFIGGDTLFGRYWGAIEHRPFLHFEVCYYQAIEFAIERGLKVVEAGAQGAHKLARGYRPVPTYSAHYIANASFRRAVADYLERERQYVEAESDELSAMMPFRRDQREEADF